MLIINDCYTNLHTLIVNETKSSDNFESKCARYLRKQFPNHKFTVKGGNNRMVADILVDDKFYIECKMTESGKKKVGAQSTGFGINLIDNNNTKLFECSDTAKNSDAAKKIVTYINSNIDSFMKLNEPNSSKVALDLDASVFAEWIYSYYTNKNVEFFITIYNGDYLIFKNTVDNIVKYFDIYAFARYYKHGSKDLPLNQRDEIIDQLKKKCKISSYRYDGKQSIVTIKSDIEDLYFDMGDTRIYLSNKDQRPNEYRVMKILSDGSPRVLFSLYTKTGQDAKDLGQFEKFLSK